MLKIYLPNYSCGSDLFLLATLVALPREPVLRSLELCQTSLCSLLVGTPANSLVRPQALGEPGVLHWVAHFLLNSRSAIIISHPTPLQ